MDNPIKSLQNRAMLAASPLSLSVPKLGLTLTMACASIGRVGPGLACAIGDVDVGAISQEVLT